MSKQDCFKPQDIHSWKSLGWNPSADQLEKFILLQKLLSSWNSELNLTRLTKGDDYWVGQIFDSLWPFKQELNNSTRSLNCIDVGTGCGFPGLAVAIALPKAKLTLVDSIGKKILALKRIAQDLELNSRIHFINQRIEVTGQSKIYRGIFDLAMARAVAEAPITAEYLIPLIKPDGQALIFRGQWSKSDEIRLMNALILLKAKIKDISNKELPGKRGKRHLIRIVPDGVCPVYYPRSIGLPVKKPLGS